MLKKLLLLTTLISALNTYAQKPVILQSEPVIVNQDTLFSLHAGQGLFDVKERAQVITKRINSIISRLDFNADSITVKNDSVVSVINYKSQLIIALNDTDAKLNQTSRQQLAANYVTILRKRLGNVFESNSVKDIIINIAETVSVIVIVVGLIWLINRVFRVIKFKLLRNWESRVAQLSKKGTPIGYVNRLLPLVTGLMRVVRLAIIILLIYIALPVAFLIFPTTKPVADELLSYITTPLKGISLAIIHYIPNLLTITVIFIVTRYVIKLVKFFALEIENGAFTIKNFYPEWANPTYNIIRVLLYAFMFVVIFPYLPGSDSKVFQGVTVFIGVLFSFGSSSAISNMVAGIVLTYMRPFKIGDRVKVGEITGDVIEKNLLVTRIRTIKNEDITIPNSTILNGAAVNYTSSSKELGLIVHTTVTIGYDAPWQTIHQLMIDAALSTGGILQSPAPFVLQTALNDFNVSYQINAYTNQSHKMAVIYSDLHKNIQDKFNEAGVEIMSPGFTALRDGNEIQIPDAYKPKGYKKPGFNISPEK